MMLYLRNILRMNIIRIYTFKNNNTVYVKLLLLLSEVCEKSKHQLHQSHASQSYWIIYIRVSQSRFHRRNASCTTSFPFNPKVTGQSTFTWRSVSVPECVRGASKFKTFCWIKKSSTD